MRTGPHTWLCQGLCLLLPLLLEDSAAQDVLFRPDWGFHSYEITVPRRLGFHVGPRGSVQQLTYLLPLGGKKHVLRLRPQRLLLPRHLRVFSFTQRGELVEDQPYVPGDCNFVGSLEGAQDSRATLSTCTGGLRGVLSIDARDFQIEPLRASSAFEHVVYLLEDPGRLLNQTCDVAEDGEARSFLGHGDLKARVRDMKITYKHSKYLDLLMIFDHDRYLYCKSNMSRITNDAILITAVLDTYFQDVFTRIYLKAIEVWTVKDIAYINFTDISRALGHFARYRGGSLRHRIVHDWAHVFAIKNFTRAVASSAGGVCWKSSCSMALLKDENILAPATWTAHEIGHGLGMGHDSPECVCKGRRNCIMGIGRTGFSNCSYEEFLIFTNAEGACLNNFPEGGVVPERCGNKIVEKGEQCDCGTLHECQKDQCCQEDCQFREGVNCSSGLCCVNCHFRPPGHVCRRPENECDLAEYCTGESNLCPVDTYKLDGTPCRYEARCFNKACPSRYMQCQNIFGTDAREAPHQCYMEVNTLGDQFGNCWVEEVEDLFYKRCSLENALCGRIQCVHVRSLPDSPDHTCLMSTHLQQENLRCWTIGYHLNMRPLGIPDTGAVGDGTSCGKDRVCFNRSCVPAQSVLNYDCLPKKCNLRGVCNNNRNCHCMYGWAPPLCEEKGFGGSIDSGPAGPLEEEISASVQIVSIMIFRLALFTISVVIVMFWNVLDKFILPAPRPRSQNTAM